MASKISQGPYKEVNDGPTKNGGAFSVSYFFDEKFNPIEKEKASNIIVHEYDSKNRSLFREYLSKSSSLTSEKEEASNFQIIAQSKNRAIEKVDATEFSPSADSIDDRADIKRKIEKEAAAKKQKKDFNKKPRPPKKRFKPRFKPKNDKDSTK